MSRTRIVAVDDDRRILRILKHACECVGFEVHSVLDADFFESAFRTFEPALVFLDLNMRNIDGVELLRFIAEERPGISVVVISGVDQRTLNAACTLGVSLGLNMLEPISKPLMVADVRQRLKLFSQQPIPQPQSSLNVQGLTDALEENRVVVSYQPMLRLKTRQVVCAEALARIHHPEHGLLKPSQFIPMAEKCGLIEPLTFAVIRTALKDLSHWSAANNDLQVAVNLSQDLLLIDGFVQHVESLLHEAKVQPQRLVFEVVERGEISDRGKLAESLTQLSDLGVGLSLNNFGSNISSLSHIYDFPYQTLKLDKQFAMHALNDENAAAMIRSSLDLARSVGLSVVVEGIQSEDTLRWLGKLGCELGQGMFISPPIPAAKFNAWLARLKQQAGSLKFEAPMLDLAACGA